MKGYKISTVLLAILSVVLFFTTVYYATNKQVKYDTVTKYDTTYVHTIDTITVTKSDIVYKNIIVLDTIYISDTAMFVEQKVFEDSLSTIYISGIEANLDSIEYRIKRDTVKIYTEKIQTVKEKDNFFKNRFVVTAGVYAGYGLLTKKPDIYVGVGCGIRIF